MSWKSRNAIFTVPEREHRELPAWHLEGLDQHRSGKACLWCCCWQPATSCCFFLKLIKGVIWIFLQFLTVRRKDQSRNVKQADVTAYSSCNQDLSEGPLAVRTGLLFLFLSILDVGLLIDICFTLSDRPLGTEYMWVCS